jgi:UDP-N-acetyl-D-galactosamine dehydrogenase
MEFLNKLENIKICIIGLGYVGLPLAVAFSEKYNVVGFDINKSRVEELLNCNDSTLEIENEKLHSVIQKQFSLSNRTGLFPTSDLCNIHDSNVYIVTVPTPTDLHNKPVLTPMKKASESIASVLKKGDVVIYESTVYPGVTEDEMVPILAKISGLAYNVDFFVGYSPERINPGDKEHTVTKILKITSGSNTSSANFIDSLYSSIITAGTYKASSIKVAESAKVIENCQRDINIAFVNELAKIFNLLNIDTQEVLEAASTKWNFLNFKPGLVGGHCIGVDPFYLAQKAQEVGFHPEIILAGRRTNDSMGKFVAQETIRLMILKGIKLNKSKILILGFTFKENCPDVRNTRVIDIFNELNYFGLNIDVYDPWASPIEVKNEYGIQLISNDNHLPIDQYSAIILAVSHNEFSDLKIIKSNNQVIYDVKSVLPKNNVDARL